MNEPLKHDPTERLWLPAWVYQPAFAATVALTMTLSGYAISQHSKNQMRDLLLTQHETRIERLEEQSAEYVSLKTELGYIKDATDELKDMIEDLRHEQRQDRRDRDR